MQVIISRDGLDNQHMFEGLFPHRQITKKELFSGLRSINPGKATCQDGIDQEKIKGFYFLQGVKYPRLRRYQKNRLWSFLEYLRATLQYGVLGNTLKVRLILLRKKDAEFLGLADIRPIQVNSVLIQVLEKTVMARIRNKITWALNQSQKEFVPEKGPRSTFSS